jgi:hypothetical protein
MLGISVLGAITLFSGEEGLPMTTQPHQPQPAAQGPVGPPSGPARKKSPVRRIVLIVAAVAVIGVLALVGRLVTDDPDVAGAGDCLAGVSAEELKVVGCTEAAARYKIAGKVDGKSQAEFRSNSTEICKPYRGAIRAFWKGTPGGNGYVLCLALNG